MGLMPHRGIEGAGAHFCVVGVAKERHDLRLQRVVEECRRQGCGASCSRAELDDLAGNNAHQGVWQLHRETIQRSRRRGAGKRGEHSLVVCSMVWKILITSAQFCDRMRRRRRVVIPERRAAGVTATVTKASAGASEHLPIAKVTNIARTLEELKGKNLWTVGLDERGQQTYDSLDYKMDCAIVLGRKQGSA